MAKHLECGCWLTDDMSKVEGVCEAHKSWQMGMSDSAYTTAEQRERYEFGERIIRMIENEERIGRWSTEIVTDIIRSNYTPVCIGEV